MARTVAIVPHTHWDREWYLPFEQFRLRLVGLLDDLLPRLDADASFTHFLLDGQMAVVDDHLAIRPDHEAVIRRLVTAGRLSVGPWYTLPDEFLVSGETLIRNLQAGIERAAAFGGAMAVGYLPDMFGHVAQMPQLLRQFGFEHAVVWRGVAAAIDRSAFWWESPDGSTVRAEYLPSGYGNGAATPDDAKAFLDRLRGWDAEHAALLAGGPILWMNGSDHLLPQPGLGAVVAEAATLAEGEYDLQVTSLARYLAGAPTAGLPKWQGELRSGAHANLLFGVASNRVDVRQAAARAERALEQLAEPMQALFAPASAWPGNLLAHAWHQLILNAAHDSVSACSADEVVDAVLVRYAAARQIAEGLQADALRFVGASTAAVGPLAVNPSARNRSGLVELTVPTGHAAAGMQLVADHAARELLLDLPAVQATPVLAEIVGWTTGLTGVRYALTDDGVEAVVFADGTTGEPPERSAVAERLGALTASDPAMRVRAWRQDRPTQTVLAHVADVPGYGWRRVESTASGAPAPVRAHGLGLDNDLVAVTVDPSDGTWSIDGVGGYGRLVDGGDVGDTYNYCPPADDVLVDRPDAVAVHTLEDGPLRARVRIEASYTWASGPAVVATELELRAGERLVRVAIALDNRGRDHRLRVHLPLPEGAASSTAECAFAVVERGLTAEGGPTEMALPTFPSRRFVVAGGLTVAHEGLLEYELVDINDGVAHTLALTLLRATGYLSRGPMATRPLAAGPELATRGSQVLGAHVLRFAVQVGPIDPYAAVDDAFLPLQVAVGAGLGALPAVHQTLAVNGAQVSSVRRGASGALEVRVFNPSASPTTVALGERSGWLVDLVGRPAQAVDGAFGLRPWGIATVVLDEIAAVSGLGAGDLSG